MLEALDRTLVGERRVVTAVRFDGVDQPTFRSAALAAADLAQVARVEIDAEDATALLLAAVDAAEDSLPELVTAVRVTATAVRDGASDTPAQLVALVGAVQSLVALTAAAATAAHLSLGETPGTDLAIVAACRELEEALGGLVTHQTAERWAALADALDTTLAPAIARWNDVLELIRERAQA
ncbi:MAG: hypothetical protein ABI880_13935 [Acidobacteriota bacterium]